MSVSLYIDEIISESNHDEKEENSRAKSMGKDSLNVSCYMSPLWKSEIHIYCSNNFLNFEGNFLSGYFEFHNKRTK